MVMMYVPGTKYMNYILCANTYGCVIVGMCNRWDGVWFLFLVVGGINYFRNRGTRYGMYFCMKFELMPSL